jgi:hypothetical protein
MVSVDLNSASRLTAAAPGGGRGTNELIQRPQAAAAGERMALGGRVHNTLGRTMDPRERAIVERVLVKKFGVTRVDRPAEMRRTVQARLQEMNARDRAALDIRIGQKLSSGACSKR